MKKINEDLKPFGITIVILFGLLFSALIWFKYLAVKSDSHKIYPDSMIVFKVDNNTDLVTIINFSGTVYQFKGCEDWEKGDVCAAIMDNNGTSDTANDDIVIQTKYCGNIKKS